MLLGHACDLNMGSLLSELDSVQWRTGAVVGKPPVPCFVPRGIYGMDIVLDSLPLVFREPAGIPKSRGIQSGRSWCCSWPTLGVCFICYETGSYPRLASCLFLPITGILDINHRSGFLGSLHSKACLQQSCTITVYSN